MFDKDDHWFGFSPDMDHDGDRDLADALIYEDVLEEEDRLTNESALGTLSVSDMDEDDILLEYGIDPDDYATREDYLDAVREARRGDCEETSDSHSLGLAISVRLEPCCQEDESHFSYLEEKRWIQNFINNGQCIASKYLTEDRVFLYVKAIKDYFKLPFDIPSDENFLRTGFETVLQALVEYNPEYAIQIWEWCLDTFMSYIEYADYKNDLTNGILIDMGNFPEVFPEQIVSHMIGNPEFVEKLILNCTDTLWCVDEFVYLSLCKGATEVAKRIMEYAFANPHTDVHDKMRFIDDCIDRCSNWETVEEMKLFEQNIFPIVLAETDAKIRKKISSWQEEMEDYIEQMI